MKPADSGVHEEDMQEVPGRPSILHLEDDPDDAALILFHLKSKKFDCTITWVSSQDHFVRALEEGSYDLILSDHRMPGFNGDDALRLVRSSHQHLPFIMLTGELGEDRAIETIKRGATDYVLKGNLVRLVPSIERALREARAEAERGRSEVEMCELKDRLARELDDMHRLHELSTLLLRGKNLDSMLLRVLEACTELLRTRNGTVQIHDEPSRSLLMKGFVGFRPEAMAPFHTVASGQGVCGLALEKDRRIIAENVHTDDRFLSVRPLFAREGVVACVSTPFRGHDGRVLGMLNAHFPRPHRPSDHELKLLDLYVQQAERVVEYVQEAC
jgi:CheY-like chemotaxis protein/putative methionine-R-sulfoxide reductase with GAF domain